MVGKWVAIRATEWDIEPKEQWLPKTWLAKRARPVAPNIHGCRKSRAYVYAIHPVLNEAQCFTSEQVKTEKTAGWRVT